jgi:hypothetical protein
MLKNISLLIIVLIMVISCSKDDDTSDLENNDDDSNCITARISKLGDGYRKLGGETVEEDTAAKERQQSINAERKKS